MLTAELKVVGGRHHGRIIPLTLSKFLVGREQDCQLRPNSEMVSRHHCVFVLDKFTIRLRDLGSTNGTFVNSQKVKGIVTLNPGDIVRIGKLDLEVMVSNSVEVESTIAADSDTVGLSSGDTSMLPGLNDSTLNGLGGNGDTTVFMPALSSLEDAESTEEEASAEDVPVEATAQEGTPVAAAPEVPQQPPAPEMPYVDPNLGVPGMMPPNGYPQQPPMPGYPQQQYMQPNPQQMGYPPYGYPQGMPQYPQPGYPMQPGFAPPGYPQQPQPAFAAPLQPQVAMPEAVPEIVEEVDAGEQAPVGKIEAPPTALPDPTQTGAQDIVVGSDPSQEQKEGEEAPSSGQNVPNAIDGILKQMSGRPPGS